MSVLPISFGAAGNPPLILVHDISGSSFPYVPFAMDPSLSQYTIYGISALSEPPSSQRFEYSSVSAWARAYADLIESVLSEELGADGRVILGGWSLGGILAAEIARIFAARSESRIQVVGLVLIDTYAPWHELLRTGPRGLEVGGREIESAYFTPAELTRIGNLLSSTKRTEWPGMDHTQCPAWLITPTVSGFNGLDEWFDTKPGRVRQIGQGKDGCDHFSMMDPTAGWIQEVIAGISDAIEEFRK
ncbi:Alpha/Beta hydrolase protein [Mycena maculata]|uniref:Alpha/Beta hydrolase protein n=1 Tax=Mycena maculata TaxID=230809 RepID=A0AAD7IZQ4_9AGAR|nr:Alpha/Beta hydrolase protein [Mycena maculata]